MPLGEMDPEALAGLEEVAPGHLSAVLKRVTSAEPAAAEDGARAAGAAAPAAERSTRSPLLKLDNLRDAGVLDGGRVATSRRRGVATL